MRWYAIHDVRAVSFTGGYRRTGHNIMKEKCRPEKILDGAGRQIAGADF